MSKCEQAEALRDYAFDELPASERSAIERHVAACADCASDLDQIRLTTAALRVLPDREIPQRIAFVSDKVFEPSRVARFFGGVWNSAARLGFASACILATALILSAYRRPAAAPTEVKTIVQTADVSPQIDAAVAKAVAQVREEDARLTKAALAEAETRHEREHRALYEAVTVLQSHLNTNTLLARVAAPGEGMPGQ